ncbi:hypothetical protein ASPZODRAFT_126902 [Penicilliopsis zonata CBS 506.65]|uniref:Histone H4 n=1 Tax=Penicilliopsis zonata CBS 506.65 TaxID=1073090 RepID=A0A1L9SUQ9_9EURO|nr:hypothetical protein ASPZODRAFT_126902 [Penicilliopsis zonata CBS 506.65]OJJ50929.1 hypothetical protein ASPZODRAFT_126902 [Penicilliopsis zonata CBS 506.65]
MITPPPTGNPLTGGFPALPRRGRKPIRDNILGVSRQSIRRLARRGGIARINIDIYQGVRQVIKDRLELLISQLVELLESGNTPDHERTIVDSRDVVYVLSRLGTPMYGF